jgi:hypothetical protein
MVLVLEWPPARVRERQRAREHRRCRPQGGDGARRRQRRGREAATYTTHQPPQIKMNVLEVFFGTLGMLYSIGNVSVPRRDASLRSRCGIAALPSTSAALHFALLHSPWEFFLFCSHRVFLCTLGIRFELVARGYQFCWYCLETSSSFLTTGGSPLILLIRNELFTVHVPMEVS